MYENNQNLLKIAPFFLEKVWGGSRLVTNGESKKIGELWGPSLIEGMISVTEQGIPLSKIFKSSEIPYLIKFIDTSDNLSVQVHPTDEFALEHEQSKGKTECWIILDCKEGAGVYLGVKNGVTHSIFEKAILSGEDVSQYLNFFPVKKGDFFVVEAGMIHAIGKDVFLAEVQQCSSITYRLWDWNRVDDRGKSRELHIEKGTKAMKFFDEKNFSYQRNIFDRKNDSPIYKHPDFQLCLKSISSQGFLSMDLTEIRKPVALVSLEGSFEVQVGCEKSFLNSLEIILIRDLKSNSLSIRGKGHYAYVY